MKLMESIQVLEERKEKMKTYLLLKVDEQDWHGVSDAANDIREIESALETLEKFKGLTFLADTTVRSAINNK